MPASQQPVHRSSYEGYTITVFAWDDNRKFYAEFDDGFNHADAALGLHDSVDEAVAACKDMIAHPTGWSEDN